jgi:two-component system response regulator LytT
MRVLIVEDEPAIARRIERFTRELLGAELTALEVCARLDDAERAVDRAAFDVVLLDLDLHGRDGYALLERAAAGAFQTIVISAHAERAIEAFDRGVLDFVAKPFDRARLERAYRRLRDRTPPEAAARVLAVRKHGEIALVPVADVRYVKGAGAYSELVLRDGRTELHGRSLDGLSLLLPPAFERIHKSYIVRLDEVVRVHIREGTRYDVELRSGVRLPIGRRRYRAVLARLSPELSGRTTS